MFLVGKPRPNPMEWSSSIPEIFGTSWMGAHSTRNNKRVMKLDMRNILQCRQRMLASDLFAVANLLVVATDRVLLSTTCLL